MHPQLGLQVFDELLNLGAARRPFDTGVDILGVLAKHDHVHVAGAGHAAGRPREVADGSHTGVQVQLLPNGHVQGTNAAAHGRRQRTLDGNHKCPQRVQGLLGQILVAAVSLSCFFTGIKLQPGDAAPRAIGPLDGGIDDLEHDRCDVNADTVAFDESHDGLVRHLKRAVRVPLDTRASVRYLDMLVAHGKARGMARVAAS